MQTDEIYIHIAAESVCDSMWIVEAYNGNTLMEIMPTILLNLNGLPTFIMLCLWYEIVAKLYSDW